MSVSGSPYRWWLRKFSARVVVRLQYRIASTSRASPPVTRPRTRSRSGRQRPPPATRVTPSEIAVCATNESGAAPCQCSSPGAAQTMSPGCSAYRSPSLVSIMPLPVPTISTWPPACECQKVRPPGSKTHAVHADVGGVPIAVGEQPVHHHPPAERARVSAASRLAVLTSPHVLHLVRPSWGGHGWLSTQATLDARVPQGHGARDDIPGRERWRATDPGPHWGPLGKFGCGVSQGPDIVGSC